MSKIRFLLTAALAVLSRPAIADNFHPGTVSFEKAQAIFVDLPYAEEAKLKEIDGAWKAVAVSYKAGGQEYFDGSGPAGNVPFTVVFRSFRSPFQPEEVPGFTYQELTQASSRFTGATRVENGSVVLEMGKVKGLPVRLKCRYMVHDRTFMLCYQEEIYTDRLEPSEQYRFWALERMASDDPFNPEMSLSSDLEWRRVFLPKVVESEHNYPDKANLTYVVRVPGALMIRLVFERYAFESGYDAVAIRDRNGLPLASISGEGYNFKTRAIRGDTAVLNLTSDSGTNKWGFAVREVIAAFPKKK